MEKEYNMLCHFSITYWLKSETKWTICVLAVMSYFVDEIEHSTGQVIQKYNNLIYVLNVFIMYIAQVL